MPIRIRLADAVDLSEWLLRIEIPRIPTTPHFDEQRIGVTLHRDVDDAIDVVVCAEGSVEGVDPVGAVFVGASACRAEKEDDWEETTHR